MLDYKAMREMLKGSPEGIKLEHFKEAGRKYRGSVTDTAGWETGPPFLFFRKLFLTVSKT